MQKMAREAVNPLLSKDGSFLCAPMSFRHLSYNLQCRLPLPKARDAEPGLLVTLRSAIV